MAQSGVRERPAPSTWSPLEYACHVRDLRGLRGAGESMKSQDGVRFLNWDQDEAAVFGRYWEQDPATVAEAYEDAAAQVAQAFASASRRSGSTPACARRIRLHLGDARELSAA